MLARMRSALTSLIFLPEEEAHYTARFVRALLPLGIGLVALLVLFPFMPGDLWRRAEVGLPTILAWGLSWRLLQRGKVRLASLLFMAGTWVVATYSAVTTAGVRSPAYLTYLVLVVYAAFLVTPGAALGAFFLSLLAGLAMVAAATWGVLPAPFALHTPLTLYASYSAGMVMIVLIILVITAEYRDAFGRLRTAEKESRLLFELDRDPAFLVNREGRFSACNTAAAQVFGVDSPVEVVGRTPASFSPERQPGGTPSSERAMQLISTAFAEGGAQSEWVYRRVDGTEFVAEVTLTAIPTQTGISVLTHVRDMTERIRAQEALRASEARLRALFSAMSDVILVLDRDARILEVVPTQPDPRYAHTADHMGKTARDLLAPEQAEEFLACISRTLETQSPTPIEYSFPVPDGGACFSAWISPLSSDTVLLVARDVTEQRQQQAQLLAAAHARAELAEHMNSEINHRARNNLAIVSGLLYMQATNAPNPEVGAVLREAVARIRTFVNLHEWVYATGAEEVDLKEVLLRTTQTLSTVFPASRVEFTVTGASCRVATQDATNVAVAANELLTNALKHSRAETGYGVRIEVQLEQTPAGLRLSVWNSGSAVPADFDPQAQSGMGLRLVLDLAQQYEGSFELRPDDGGVRATLTFPGIAVRALRRSQ